MCESVLFKLTLHFIYFLASALHRFVFFPNKLNIRSSAELKAGPATVTSAAGGIIDGKTGKGQTLEMIMFRLVTFMASAVSLPFKNFEDVSYFPILY